MRALLLSLLFALGLALAQAPTPINPDWSSAKDSISAGVVPVMGIMAIFLIVSLAAAAVWVVIRAVSPHSDED